MKGSINSVLSSGFVDGPGIRTVVFFNGCKLRCKFCHNPEMFQMQENNYTVDELVERILKNKAYFGKSGGVTFSGGEPLLQDKFLLEVCKKLKQYNIHIALDTAGVGNGNYEEVLSYVDLVLLDIKAIDSESYLDITGYRIDESLKFIESLNKLNKKVWIRQVIIPSVNDNLEYMDNLSDMLCRINKVERVDFLPYHKMGSSKYLKLGLIDPYAHIEAMDKQKCDDLYNEFTKMYKKKRKR